jgi:hypothetical protein
MTGAKPVLLGPSAGSASFKEICTPGVKNFWLARATPHPANPRKRIMAAARILDFPPNLCKFMGFSLFAIRNFQCLAQRCQSVFPT